MRCDYKTKCKDNIYKILEEFKDTTLSADEILLKMEENGCKVNKTTIYRNLDRMETDGIVHKFPSSDTTKSLYQLTIHNANIEEHLHLQCSSCGKVIHLDCEYMQSFIEHIALEHDFDLTCDKSILFGLCKQCKEKENINEQ